MYKTFKSSLYILATTAIIVSCSSDKSAQLDSLKKKRAELDKEIAALEKEVKTTDTTSVKIKAKEVAVSELAPREFNHYVQTQGLIETDNNVLVSPQSMGIITQVYVKEGQTVSKGQLLAQIDNSVIVRSIDELKGGLDLAKTVFERQKNLWEQKIGTEVQYLQAKNNKESLEKRLATLQEQLDMTKIKSPISGTVDAINTRVGENVGPGMPTFRVINTTDLKVALKISEAYINKIQKGNKVAVSIPDINKSFTSNIDFVGKNIDPLSRSFPVEVKLPSATELRPNMTAVLKVIFFSEPAALCVPVNVVQEINGEKVIYVAENDGKQTVARKRIVKIDGVYDNLAQIISGLKSGDKVITVGYQGLNDGEFIKI